MSERAALHLFEGYGIELEYMLVDRQRLDVLPATDQLIAAAAGRIEAEIERGPLAWSNELALHVIELKTNGPAPALEGLAAHFQRGVGDVERLLSPLGGRLLPGGMHPWMDPYREMRLWPHEYNEVYAAFNRIFDCRGHGFANLQSMHLNLPFADDEEFCRLHAGVRLLLPLLPGLAASSPVADGRPQGRLDHRLEVYRHNSKGIPSITGELIPEPVYRRADYEAQILGRIYADLAPHDPQGVLRHEFANARGAIARFSRMAIEIRIIDTQECPRMDLAIAAAAVAVLKGLAHEVWQSVEDQMRWPTARLSELLLSSLVDGERAVIRDREYLAAFQQDAESLTVGELWRRLLARLAATPFAPAEEHRAALEHILEHGPLARRLLARLGAAPSRTELHAVYAELADCLAAGRMFP